MSKPHLTRLERAAWGVVTKTIGHPGLPQSMLDLSRALTMTPRQLRAWTRQAKIASALLRERQKHPTQPSIDEAIRAGHELLRELIRAQAGRVAKSGAGCICPSWVRAGNCPVHGGRSA